MTSEGFYIKTEAEAWKKLKKTIRSQNFNFFFFQLESLLLFLGQKRYMLNYISALGSFQDYLVEDGKS